MLVLTNEDVEGLVEMPSVIEVLRGAYRDLGSRDAVEMPRQDGVVDHTRDGTVYALKTMSGNWPAGGVSAVRINSDVVNWPSVKGSPRRVKIPLSQGSRYNGLVLLFSTATGELLCLFNDGYAQKTRVGATSGLAADYLARPDARVMGLLGTGWQATGQIEAMAAVRDLAVVKVYSPTKAHREGFARTYAEVLGVEVRPVDSPARAAEGADILVSATNSMMPTVDPAWLKPGMHVTTVRGSEIGLPILERVDRLVVNTDAPVQPHAARGFPSRIPEFANGDYARPDMGTFDMRNVPELKDVVAGIEPGRVAEDEITCFHSYKGLGLQFAAIGSIIYQQARERGLGLALDDHLFSQAVHP